MDIGQVQYPGAPAVENELASRVLGSAIVFEGGIGRDFRERSQRFYKQYRGFRDLRDNWVRASPNDRDGMLYDAKKQWGAHLHIPLSFRTIETIVPKVIAQMPELLVLPRDEAYEESVESVKMLIDAQQQQIDIDLAFQEVMRLGRIYGLGVGKSYWKREVRNTRVVEPRAFGLGFKKGELRPRVIFDDPMFEAVDIFDFMWDPYGSSMESCDWVIHRIWASTDAVLKRLQEPGMWETESAKLLTEDKVKQLGGEKSRYDEVWQQRMQVSGLGSYTNYSEAEPPHELLEFHDGERVLTVLDRQVLVQNQENPCCGQMPFQIYRPTPLSKQMVGIGDLEPLEHLQRELDTLRSQRRDAATLALCAGYAYDSSAVSEEDLTFGPGSAIEVRNASPRDALMPLTTKEVPGSGYQEESVIRSDIESVSGIADALDNSPGGTSSTATEAQLVQAALGARIELGSRRFEVEVVRRCARAFLAMDQRMILANRTVRQPEDGLTIQEAADVSKWKWYEIGPGELRGDYEIVEEGGTMAARNIPQERNDAAQLMNLFGGDFYVDPTKMRLLAMRKAGIKHPKAYLRAAEPSVPMVALTFLRESGRVDPNLLAQAELRARAVSAPEEGRNDAGGEVGVGDVNAAMGVAQ